MFSKIRDYALVTVVAVLIWLYAESENVKDHTLAVQLQFVAPPGRELLIRPGQPGGPVTVVFRCNSSQLSQLRQYLDSNRINIELYDDPTRSDPRQEVNVRDRMAEVPYVVSLGVGVLEATPGRIDVTVERMETRRVPVVVRARGENLLADAVADPAEIAVRAPASVAAGWPQDAVAEVVLQPSQLERLELNRQHTLAGLAVNLSDTMRGSTTSITPATVRATFTIRSLTKDLTLPNVAVRIVAPIAELAKYDVTLVNEEDQFLRDVHLRGPNETIDRIESREIKIWADVALEIDDLAKGATRENVPVVPVINKPASVMVVEPPAPIKLKIVKRAD